MPWEVAPEQYHALLDAKVAAVKALFAPFDPPPSTVYPSPPLAYRNRAEFRLWHDGEDSHYAMFDPAEPRQPRRVDAFPAALPAISSRMEPLRQYILSRPRLRKKLFQVEFMGASTGASLVTLAYHRPLDEHWTHEAETLAAALDTGVVGRSRRAKTVIGGEHIVENVEVDGHRWRYRQYEQSFVQPNTPVNQAMLQWACDRARELGGDLLELYCGNGNFTLPLSRHFGRVLATELSKSGTRAAKENLSDNGVDNVTVIRLSAEEVSQALAGVREFRRLADLPQPLSDYRLDTVLVDPPRAGLDDATLRCVQNFRNILYISCNPLSLLENLSSLSDSHQIAATAFFDQFPYTSHLECGLLLQRR